MVFNGNAAIASADLLTVVELRPGAAWTAEKESFDREILISLYHNSGYMGAEAAVSSLRAGTSAFITVDIKEGPLYNFGSTAIAGLRALSEKTVKKELAYREGEPYGYSKLIAAQSRLYSANWFEELRTSISSSSASREISVRITAREKPMLWMKAGLGYGSEEKERLSLGFTHNNFLNKGYQAQVTGTLSRIWLEYHAEMLNRHFLLSSTELRNGITYLPERPYCYHL